MSETKESPQAFSLPPTLQIIPVVDVLEVPQLDTTLNNNQVKKTKGSTTSKKAPATMRMCQSPKCRLLSMLSLTFSFFLVELIVGYISNSTALIADSFHMLSDVVALVIAFISIRMSPKKWSKNTFGWARAEVLGALINAVFLLALCFSIFVEALKRFVDPENLHNPQLVLGVGIIGLLVNIIGLFLFHGDGHGHSHGGGHGHSHGAHIHTDDHDQSEEMLEAVLAADNVLVPVVIDTKVDRPASNGINGKVAQCSSTTTEKVHKKRARNMNMHGVFLHVLADALGSVIVIISALIVHYTKWRYNAYVDPALSVIMVLIIGYSTLPLLKGSALILLQTVPTHIQVDSLQRKLLQEIEGVLAVHEFHVWQLAGERIIASAHIRCRNLHDYQQIAEKVKEFFHNEGIHSTTIQPEFVEFETVDEEDYEEHSYSGGTNSTSRIPSGGQLSQNQVGGPAILEMSANEQPESRWGDNCALDCPPGPGDCMQNTCCGPQKQQGEV